MLVSFEEETVEPQAAAPDNQADETFEKEPVESQPVLQPFEPTTPRAPGAEEVAPAAEPAAEQEAAAVEEVAAEAAAEEVAAEPATEDEDEEYEDEFEEGEESMSQPGDLVTSHSVRRIERLCCVAAADLLDVK